MFVSMKTWSFHLRPVEFVVSPKIVCWLLLQFMVALPAMAQSGTSKYNLVRLQPAANVSGVTAEDVNNSANVVGTYQSSSGLVGYFYEHAAAAGQKYKTLGSSLKPYGLNEFNEMVGSDEQLQLGVYWASPTSVPGWLPPLTGDAVSRGQDINNSGVVVGISRLTPTSALSVVAWRLGTAGQIQGPVMLPTPDGFGMAVVRGLSEEVEGITTVVGRSAIDPTRGVVWSVGADASGNPVCLNAVELALASDVHGVNDFGDVAGATATTPAKPFLKYAENDPGQLTLLSLISKATSGTAFDVNNQLQVAGENSYVSRGTFISRAVLWTNPQTAVDLNLFVTLGKSESLTRAYEINDRGDILVNLAKNGSSVGPCLLISP
ncbi:MAG: hypothetical protein JNL58_31760 [Planctomyces sp.]|nr:hypothetical protein [Planctomyces sp.]